MLLNMGTHHVEANASGYIAEKRTLRVKGGEEVTVRLLLLRAGNTTLPTLAPTSLRAADAVSDEPKPWYKSPWLWVGVGALVAGAAGTGIYFAMRDSGTPRAYNGTTNAVLFGP